MSAQLRSLTVALLVLITTFIANITAAQDYHIEITGHNLSCSIEYQDPMWGGMVEGSVTVVFNAPQKAVLYEFFDSDNHSGGPSLDLLSGNGSKALGVGWGGSPIPVPYHFNMSVSLYSPDSFLNEEFQMEGTLYDTDEIEGVCEADGTLTITHNTSGDAGFQPNDNRINPDAGAPFSAYCTDWGLAVYGVNDSSDGYLAFSQTNEQLGGDIPNENTLLAESGDIRLYRLTTGELQINASPDAEGKEYILTWNGCPLTYSQAAIFDHTSGQTTSLDAETD